MKKFLGGFVVGALLLGGFWFYHENLSYDERLDTPILRATRDMERVMAKHGLIELEVDQTWIIKKTPYEEGTAIWLLFGGDTESLIESLIGNEKESQKPDPYQL